MTERGDGRPAVTRAGRRAWWWRPAVAAVAAGLLVGCAAGPSSDDPAAVSGTGPSVAPRSAPTATTPALAAVDPAPVLARIAAAAAPAGVTVAAVVLDGAGRALVTSPDAGTPLPAASLVKLLVVQQLLERQVAGSVQLDPDTTDRMARAVIASDDEAMSTLWTQYDGPTLVQDAAISFGLTGTAPPADPGQWGDTTTTAADLATFLAALSADPRRAGAVQVLEWMRGTSAVAADGFDQRFGLFAGVAGQQVAVKQGWACCVVGRRQLHSVAVLSDGRVVALLADTGEAVPYADLRTVVDEAAAALVEGTG